MGILILIFFEKDVVIFVSLGISSEYEGMTKTSSNQATSRPTFSSELIFSMHKQNIKNTVISKHDQSEAEPNVTKQNQA